jgi:hypothetical protein
MLLNNCTSNTPPSVSGATLSRTQGNPATVSQIATVSDSDQAANTLSVTVTPLTGMGVTVGPVSIDVFGNVTASVWASCTATTSTFEVKAVDDEDGMTTSTLTVNVTANTAPTLSYTNKSLGVGKTALFYPSTGPSDNFSISSIMLQSVMPATGLALSVNNSTGVVSVLSATIAGTYAVSIVATDNCGLQRVATFNVTVTCPTTTLSTLANGQAGIAYNRTITVTPAGSYTFAVTGGALPPGLMLDTMTGAVTGTPTATGTFNFTVLATASSGCSGMRSYSLVISCPAVTITPTTLPAGTLGVAYSQMLTAGPMGSYTFVISFGSLPPGMTLNAMTGELSGVPTLKGSYYVTIRAGGFGLCTGTRSYLFVIQ